VIPVLYFLWRSRGLAGSTDEAVWGAPTQVTTAYSLEDA